MTKRQSLQICVVDDDGVFSAVKEHKSIKAVVWSSIWVCCIMMLGYKKRNDESENPWDTGYPSGFIFDTGKVENINRAALNFQTFEGEYEEDVNNPTNNRGLSFLNPTLSNPGAYDAHIRTFSLTQSDGMECEFAEEPPLLEELGINPSRIFEKSLAVLNPFHSNGQLDMNLLYEADLAGPVALCIVLGTCLLLAGAKAHFGYVYGLVTISCIAMYFLLKFMATEDIMSLGFIASVLGYCFIPIVLLSILGVFLSLYSSLGFVCAMLAVIWSSLSASKLFVSISGDTHQRLLIAYPCALLYGTFALIIVF
jgi:hypothetical protein